MFWSRHEQRGRAGAVEIAFTDRHGGVSAPPFDSLDLGGAGTAGARNVDVNFSILAKAFAVERFTTMHQVHGRDVCTVNADTTTRPTCDGLITLTPGVALCVRVADCVPVALADPDAGVVAVAHAGRRGIVAGVLEATIEAMRSVGADQIRGWIGPHVCGGCYEVPVALRAEVSEVARAAFACTTWGTASLDLGAAVRELLEAAEVDVVDASACTRETSRLYSHRRDHAGAGRFAGIVVLRGVA